METRYHYVSLDSDHDISADTLQVSFDRTTWAPAVPIADADLPPTTAGLTAPGAGRTRYWWRILVGPDQTLIPPGGRTRLYGQLTDLPERLEPSWTIST